MDMDRYFTCLLCSSPTNHMYTGICEKCNEKELSRLIKEWNSYCNRLREKEATFPDWL